jgi:MYXO-CTERM domain-containing protein
MTDRLSSKTKVAPRDPRNGTSAFAMRADLLDSSPTQRRTAMTLLSNRTKWMLLTGLVSMLAAGTAAAQSNPTSCDNDDDCIATPACGGDVCEWPAHVCKPAGSAAKGADGWCTTTADCKCMGMGATCEGVYCSFTRACDAPGQTCATGGTGGSTGAGGSTGTAGTSGGGSSDGGGCSVAATAPAAGSALIVALGLIGFSRRRRR